MRVSIPATFLITLSAHHYLSHALPLSRAHSVAPRAVDYPVVSVADPDVEAPDLAPGDNEDDDNNDDIVTRTVTRESASPIGTRTPKGSATSTEDCITGGVVPIVGVKETGAVRSTTTYTTRSSSKTPVVSPTPSPSPSPSTTRPTETEKTSGSTSEASVSEPTPSATASSMSSPDGPTNSRNGTSPITSSPAIITTSKDKSLSTATEHPSSFPGVIIDTEPEPEPEREPTLSSAPWSTAPSPVPSGDDSPGDEYNEEDYDQEDYDDGGYAEDEYLGDVYDGDEDAIPTTVSIIPPPLSTGNSRPTPDDSSNDPSWNGTVAYRFRRFA